MPEGQTKDALANLGAIRDSWAKHLEHIDTVMRDYKDGKIGSGTAMDCLRPYEHGLGVANGIAATILAQINAEKANRRGARK